MNNVCPNCQAVYVVQPKDVGRRIKCKRCNVPLVVDANGLRLDDGSPIGSAPGAETPMVTASTEPLIEEAMPTVIGSKPLPRQPDNNLLIALESYGIDASTLIFSLGAFFAIVFLFFPLIDQASAARKRANLTVLDIESKLKDLELEEKGDKATEKEKELRQKEKKEELKEIQRLELDARLAEVEATKNNHMNRYGMLFGYLLLAFGAIGFISNPNPGIKRTVGAIVICTQMVLIFLLFTTSSGVSSFR